MIERMLIEVRGIVQGVGFRPRVYSLATSLGLRGEARNRGAHLLIDLEGDPTSVRTFLDRLPAAAPAHSQVDEILFRNLPLAFHPNFAIVPSVSAQEDDVRISPDLATCDACLAELFDRADRRYRYPFINCTNCGPRFTITIDVPYDRHRTTMRRFPMCAACFREYEDPSDRRFHAEAIACQACGPTLRALDNQGSDLGPDDPIGAAVAALRRGAIVAVKGLGGYHLACDATSRTAVGMLRRRKRRDDKPLAIMVSTADVIRTPGELRDLLTGSARPIVLVDRCALPDELLRALAPDVAAGCPALGVMLPYTPLHHLLLSDVDRPLVMTSGNRTDEPIAYENRQSIERLGGIADLFLTHDRQIEARCDDSVCRILAGRPSPVRRARGYAPAPITLSEVAPLPVLAVGGHLKNTVCVLAGSRASLSTHIGDLESAAAYVTLAEEVARWRRLLGVAPAIVAHDLHPDYLSTRFAHEYPAERRIPVQHHHAHVLSCAAEHGFTAPLIGVAFDGAGLGTDGAVWGGEFLLTEGPTFRRMACLGYVPMPGGDVASRQPWRMALAHIRAAFEGEDEPVVPRLLARVSRRAIQSVRRMIDTGVSAPPTSSAGRLFDAVAAIVGLRDQASFEGQAAMELEAIAHGEPSRAYGWALDTSADPWIVDVRPLIRDVVEDVLAGLPPEAVSTAFHETLAATIAHVASEVAARTGVRTVALTGGVFQNARLTSLALDALRTSGLNVLTHSRVPCNDGGLSLGQALVAARILRGETEQSSCA